MGGATGNFKSRATHLAPSGGGQGACGPPSPPGAGGPAAPPEGGLRPPGGPGGPPAGGRGAGGPPAGGRASDCPRGGPPADRNPSERRLYEFVRVCGLRPGFRCAPARPVAVITHSRLVGHVGQSLQ